MSATINRLVPLLAVLVLLCAALLVGAAGPVTSPDFVPYRWRNVVVGGGGFAPGILFSRAEPGLAYLRTDMGGAYRWEQAEGRWIPLQDGNAESSFMGIESIAPHPRDPQKVYLAAGMHKGGRAAIWRSGDRGETWTITELPIAMGGNEAGRGLGERLAVDPHQPEMLLFGSRHDGLWRSSDGGISWARDWRFPFAGRGVRQDRSTNGGIAFVVFDQRAGSRRVFAGVADAGAQGLYHSDNGGKSWIRLPGGPVDLLPVKADIDANGTLYVAFADGIGPSGIMRGAVWALDEALRWRDITPDRRKDVPPGGYMGISADWQNPGTVLVATMNRWKPGDTLWRTRDGGRSWTDLGPASSRNTTATPFLNWGHDEAELGHWIAGLAIDPFNPSRAAYTTGATIYVTDRATAGDSIVWRPWTEGVEQTAVITLVSPTGGAQLVSGFGDLGGFVHDDLTRSPRGMHLNPRHTNTNTLDYAGRAPLVLVRSGNVHADQDLEAGLGWSMDGGYGWRPLRTPFWSRQGMASLEASGRAPITVSADGRRFYVGAEEALASDDRGNTWRALPGAPPGTRIVTDKVDPDRAWALDVDQDRLLQTRNGGRSFTPVAASGACGDFEPARPRNRESQAALVASPFASGHLYFQCGEHLFLSIDGGERFTQVDAGLAVHLFGLGKPAPGSDAPALYAIGERDGRFGVWRSVDTGRTWRRINDDAHRWGHRFRAISGDPRLFGRVYIATDGRGIVYGDAVRADLRDRP